MRKYNIKNLSNNLRALRKDTKKSQIKVSAEMNLELRTYQRYESDTPPDIKLSNLVKILKYYNVTLEELLK